MLRLIYISTARGTVTADDLRTILLASRRRNAAAGVTGLLVAGGRRFLQALEGPDAAVEATFSRIGLDPRHHAVVVLRREAITTRAFPQWAMGHRNASAGRFESDDLRAVVAALVAGIEDPTIRAYFTGFAEVNAAA